VLAQPNRNKSVITVANNNLFRYFFSILNRPFFLLGRVARRNFTPGPHRSGRESLPSSGSYYPAAIKFEVDQFETDPTALSM